MRSIKRAATRVAVSTIFIASGAATASAADFQVTLTTDPAPNGCAVDGCSLREAILDANVDRGADVVRVPAGNYALTIRGAGENEGRAGDLDVLGQLTIVGAGARTTVVDGGAIDRVLDIPIDETPDIEFDQLLVRPANSVVTVEGLTLRNGSPPDVGPFFPFIFPGLGGAARNAGTLTMTDVTLRDSVATDAGGLRNDGTVTLDRVTVRDNRSLTFGGGVLNNGTATLRNVTVSGNTAATADGGVLNFASTVPNAMTVTNSTITGNGAPNGANLTNAGDAPLTGGVMGQLTIRNSLVANPLDASGNPVSNCPAVSAGAGVITSGGGNLEFPGESCGFNQASDVRADPQVGALADNGGATDTRALPPVSPALNRAVAANCPTVDQRAIARPQGPGCDIGAFELERPQLVLAKTGRRARPPGRRSSTS
jgi:CSLREA domain-containing protein